MTEQEQIQLAIQDFRFFLKLVWKHLRLPKPTRMQLYIADYLQKRKKRKQLQALRGIGKGQPLDCKVLAKDGWTTIGELYEGQEIYGQDGKLQKVEQLHNISSLECYEFEFSDGRKTRCDIDHLWKVFHQGKWQTLTTKQILDKGIYYNRSITPKNTTGKESKFKIPLVEPIQFEEKQLPINPYVLGYLIGDGSLTKGISFTIDGKDKEEVKSYFVNEGYTLGKERPDTRRPAIYQVGVLGLNKTIKELGLNVKSEHKRIPKEYFTSSVEQRISLLQGLLDSDGYCNKSFEFVSKGKGLSEDVLELARSLGCIATIKPHQHGWRVYIQSKINLCRLQRKANNFKAMEKDKLSLTNVTSIGVQKRRCITVSNSDSLYITDNYIVTHNTWITGAYVCWRLLRNPNEKVVIVSQTGGHADNIAIFIRQLIKTMPILVHLEPRKDQRKSTVSFDVNGCEVSVQPSVKALGITSQLQGNRASILISDDVEGQQNSATEKRRADLLKAVGEYEAILQTDDNSEILVLGTPQSIESIYNKMETKGYFKQVFPARYPEDVSIYNGTLAEYIQYDLDVNPELAGKSIDSRFSDQDLLERELSYGKSEFNLQFQLDVTLSDANKYPLKLRDLIIADLSPSKALGELLWTNSSSEELDLPNLGFTGDRLYRHVKTSNNMLLPYQGTILAIDPAGMGQDEIGFAVVSHLSGMIYVPEFGGMSGGYSQENLIKLAEIAETYQVNKIVMERNFGDGMFASLLQPVLNAIYPCMIEEVRNSTQKELRIIDTLEPLLNQHRLVFSYSAVEKDINEALVDSKRIGYSLIHQLSHITKDRGSLQHDDRLDALTIGVSYWKDYGILKQNTAVALDRYEKAQIEKELKRRQDVFHKHQKALSGNKTKGALSSIKAFRR